MFRYIVLYILNSVMYVFTLSFQPNFSLVYQYCQSGRGESFAVRGYLKIGQFIKVPISSAVAENVLFCPHGTDRIRFRLATNDNPVTPVFAD